MQDRRAARAMAQEAVTAGEPLRWFEQLYEAAATEGVTVPWADLAVNPHLASWASWASGDGSPPSAGSAADPERPDGGGRRALVVGCGYGDDAEWLAARAFTVTAFDISSSAVDECRRRFPDSAVDYCVANLLEPPENWLREPFDLVVEAYTVQVLPPDSPERAAAIGVLAALTGGTLLVIARGRDAGDDPGAMPWPLTAAELEPLVASGLEQVAFDDFLDDEQPPTRRFRVTYRRS